MQNLVGEQIVDVPVPQIQGDVVQHVPERVQSRTLEQITKFPVPQILEESVQNRTPEQIMDFPVPRIMEAVVEVVPSTPQERVLEQIMDFPVPRIMEAVVEVVPSTPQERVLEQIMDFPMPRIMEAAMEVLPSTPQECVQNRTRRLFVDVPVPHIKEKIAGKVKCTGKVFTVPHHCDDQACTLDTVGLHIKGLDKFNLPRVGDVMVPAPQITKGVVGHVEKVVSWFDRKSQVAADEPLYRFQTKRSGRSSRSKLKR